MEYAIKTLNIKLSELKKKEKRLQELISMVGGEKYTEYKGYLQDTQIKIMEVNEALELLRE